MPIMTETLHWNSLCQVEESGSGWQPRSLAAGVREGLLAARASPPTNSHQPDPVSSLKVSLSKLAVEEEDAERWSVDDTESEASIITLGTSAPSDSLDFDDFGDLQPELDKWISKN